MVSELTLATTRDFNGIKLNCYRDEEQEDPQDFWATREQIGLALGYKDPIDAIKKIHKRNRERLDKFSRGDKMSLHEKNRTVTRGIVLYNFKGLLEICRYSNQPNAHKVIDVLWDIADEIRRTGMYMTNKAIERLEKRVAELERQAEANYPVLVLGRCVMPRPEAVTFQEAANFLFQYGLEAGQNRLFREFREHGLLCSRKG